MEPYKKLSEDFDDKSVDSAPTPVAAPAPGMVPPPVQVPPPPVPQVVQMPPRTTPVPVLRKHKLMKGLAILQLVTAVLILLFGSVCVGLAITSGNYFCSEGTGVWSGVFCVVAGGFAVGAVFKAPSSSRCLMIAYFVLAIIATVLSGFIVLFSGIWVSSMQYRYYSSYYRDYINQEYDAGYAIQFILIVLGLIHFVSCIVSTSLICYNWNRAGGCCGDSPAPPPVLYLPASSALGASGQNEQFVLVPVSFVPQQGGTGGGGGVNGTTVLQAQTVSLPLQQHKPT
jgi:hypothetical protein